MAVDASGLSFWSENLQQSILAAGQQGKTLLCFVNDESEISTTWNSVITSDKFKDALLSSTIRLRLRKDTQDFGFLNAICPIRNAPALVLINGGKIEMKLEPSDVTEHQLRERLGARFATGSVIKEQTTEPDKVVDQQCLDFEPSAGRMRLPNNAYDSLRERTERLKLQKIAPKSILAIRSRPSGVAPALPGDVIDRLLNTPASMLQPHPPSDPSTAPTASSSTPDTANTNTNTTSIPSRATAQPVVSVSTVPSQTLNRTSSTSTPNSTPTPSSEPQAQSQRPNQRAQQVDYLKQQREREASQRAERERIKEQIKRDREERRRLDMIRKEGETATTQQQNSTASPSPSRRDIRVQVRTFDGSTLRTTFSPTATVSGDVRPWIDSSYTDTTPYNLKIILTPLPNQNIEPGEEDRALPDLGITGSATLVMVPIQGFVTSYAGPSTAGGVAGSVIGGLMGAGGTVVNGVLGLLGWGSSGGAQNTDTTTTATNEPRSGDSVGNSSSGSGNTIKVRTLADQRADEEEGTRRKLGNRLYNGNSLNFQGRKEGDDESKED